MAPFVRNGVYTISNVQFNGQAVDLVGSHPIGGIGGQPVSGSIDQLWRITNIGAGGNQITIESLAATGSFVNARRFQGVSYLVGGSTRAVWTVVKVDRGYYLQSPDANFVWQLPGDYEQIILVRHTGKDNTKWEFTFVGE